MYRYTFSFELYGQGFSETMFRANAFAPGELGILENYLAKRLNLMCTDARVTSIRGSNTDTKRDIQILFDPTILRTGTWAYGGSGTSSDAGTPTNAEDTFTAILLRLTDSGANYRSFAMLALPDYVFQGNIIVPDQRPILVGRLNSWIASMSAAAMGMKAQGVPLAAGKINDFPAKTVDNQLVCLGLKGAIPPVGSLVTLGAVKPFFKLNRTWRVAATAPASDGSDGFIYLANTAYLNTFGPVEGGTYKQSTFGVSVLTQYTISRLTSRKTGVPFGTVRGRR